MSNIRNQTYDMCKFGVKKDYVAFKDIKNPAHLTEEIYCIVAAHSGEYAVKWIGEENLTENICANIASATYGNYEDKLHIIPEKYRTYNLINAAYFHAKKDPNAYIAGRPLLLNNKETLKENLKLVPPQYRNNIMMDLNINTIL